MALPLRRVLIGLSVRLQLSIREVESWDMPTIREYMAYLMNQGKPAALSEQTPAQVESGLLAMFAPPNK